MGLGLVDLTWKVHRRVVAEEAMGKSQSLPRRRWRPPAGGPNCSGEGLEKEKKAREIPIMNAVKVDKQKRVRLKIFTPGDYYQPDFSNPEMITLRRIEPPKPKTKMTAAEVRTALEKITVKAKAGWDGIRRDTREL